MFLMLNLNHLQAQYIPVPNSYIPLYEFIEELRSDNFCTVSTFNGPLSEKEISDILNEARRSNKGLNYRQRNEIGHYLREFQLADGENKGDENDVEIFRSGNTSLSLHPFGFFWGNENSSFRIKPIGGAELTLNDQSGSLYYHKGFVTSGNIHNFAYYGKIHDQTYTDVHNQPLYLNSIYNYNQSALLKDMMSGGISFANAWLTLSVAHDKMHLGTSIKDPIYISHKSPTFNQLNIILSPTSWFKYNYMIGDLGKIESNIYSNPQLFSASDITGDKRLALNQLTFYPIPSIHLSLGQLSVFSKTGSQWSNHLPLNYYKVRNGFHPLLFYQLNMSTIPHVDVNFTHFFEAFSSEYLTYRDPKNHAGMQGQLVISNWPLQNIILKTEYTYVSPFSLTENQISFQHAGYPLGWYLGDHSDRLYISGTVKPVHNLQLVLSYENSKKGDYSHIDLQTPHYFNSFESIHWKESVLGFCFRHQTSYYTQLFAGIYRISRKGENTEYRTAPFLQNRSYSFNLGINIGY